MLHLATLNSSEGFSDLDPIAVGMKRSVIKRKAGEHWPMERKSALQMFFENFLCYSYMPLAVIYSYKL